MQKSFTTSTDVSGAKRTMDIDGTKLLVSEGRNGLGVYDINSGSKLQTIDTLEPWIHDGNSNNRRHGNLNFRSKRK